VSALLPVELTVFVRHDYEKSAEFAGVASVADRLLSHLNGPAARASVAAVNLPGSSSGLVQGTFLEFSRELGFVDESTGLFASYESRLRPDYFLRVGDTGILLEVERGKTTINNMDLLDFWKCHLCEHAQYLFLMVPKALRQNATMSPRNEYATVARRLHTFFRPRNYTNVRGLFLFGY
jgi:hypothetical protein